VADDIRCELGCKVTTNGGLDAKADPLHTVLVYRSVGMWGDAIGELHKQPHLSVRRVAPSNSASSPTGPLATAPV
jgi:hypothetical protein